MTSCRDFYPGYEQIDTRCISSSVKTSSAQIGNYVAIKFIEVSARQKLSKQNVVW